MLKFVVLILLVVAVIVFFALRQTPKRPPRDWRRGSDDGGPVLPGTFVAQDTSRKPANDPLPDDPREPAHTDSGQSDGGGADGGGGGGGD